MNAYKIQVGSVKGLGYSFNNAFIIKVLKKPTSSSRDGISKLRSYYKLHNCHVKKIKTTDKFNPNAFKTKLYLFLNRN